MRDMIDVKFDGGSKARQESLDNACGEDDEVTGLGLCYAIWPSDAPLQYQLVLISSSWRYDMVLVPFLRKSRTFNATGSSVLTNTFDFRKNRQRHPD
jgi:hypothetical protein